MNVRFLGYSVGLVLLAAACSSDDTSGVDNPYQTGGSAGTGLPALAGTGAARAGTGAAGSLGPATGYAGTYGVAGIGAGAGTYAAGTSGSAGAAGSLGAAGTVSAGSGGVGGAAGVAAAGVGGGTTVPSGDGYVREAAPTDDSIRKAGEYSVKSYTEAMGLIGGDAYGGASIDGSALYYPEGATPPFAAVVIVPGFTALRTEVANWGPFLASHGIVALVIDTNTTGDQPDVRSRGLLDALESLKKENMRAGSPVEGKIDTARLGLMGWSMGGGGTWISANAHPELKAAISLCGWLPGGSAPMTAVPSLQFAARDDGLAAGMSQPVYNSIPMATPKQLIEFIAPPGSVLGGHYIANDPANMTKQVGAFGLSWLKVFLEGDKRYTDFIKKMPTDTSDYMTNQ